MANLAEELKYAAAYSKKIIEKAQNKDSRVFDYARGARKYFELVSKYDADNYVVRIDQLEYYQNYYHSNCQYEAADNIYKSIEKYIPEAFGNLFKKMLMQLREEGQSDKYTSNPSYSNSKSSNSTYTSSTSRYQKSQDYSSVSVANPYLDGRKR